MAFSAFFAVTVGQAWRRKNPPRSSKTEECGRSVDGVTLQPVGSPNEQASLRKSSRSFLPAEASNPSSRSSSVRSAAKKVIAMNRVSRQAAPRLPETIFDSPLQQALHILSRLADGLAEAGDEESAAKAMHIAQLLHSKHLHASGIIDEISLGSVTAGDGVHGWLASMELMPQAGPENKSGHHA